MIADGLNPALILIVGAALVPFVPRRWHSYYLLLLPVLAAIQLCTMPYGEYGQLSLFSQTLVTLRLDRLSFVFALIFHIAALLAVIYALHVRDTLQHMSAFVYAGAGIGAVLAGDLITLFVYWEVTAIASVFLIWARGTERAYQTGMRYLIIQVASGVILLAGVVMHAQETGSIAFSHLSDDFTSSSLGIKLIFLAFGIKCAFPLLHNWLQDAYPEATVTGTVVLSAFTTKLAVYALARGFAGTDMLIWIGATMTAFPIFYAVIENDLRRVLAYSLNNQLGFMVVGIGIGTELALNGTAAHAFCHILYKALLFMSMGAVLLRTGTINGSQLGGLYKSMPYTAVFCIIGAASISAFPLFSGFISKSMILLAAAEEHHTFVYLVLLFASAGVFHHSGIKIPYFAFFAHDAGFRVKEAPTNMLIAMGITAFLCVAIGLFPGPLYGILPFEVDFAPYTTTHVITQLQLLFFSALAFTFLMKTGLYPPELKSVNLDSDWIYRKFFPKLLRRIGCGLNHIQSTVYRQATELLRGSAVLLQQWFQPGSAMVRSWQTGTTVYIVIAMLGVILLLSFINR